MTNNFILNGFDRCGSTAISRSLATHPDIELIMQPFNNGNIRKKIYQVLDDDNTTAEDHAFFEALEKNKLLSNYIKSEWHFKYSTVQQFQPGKLHLIKTTQNHFTISWIKHHFPLIELWGIWREPMDILASLVRNNFHIKWYSGAIKELSNTVDNHQILNEIFGKYINQANNPVREMAFIIATRTWFYFSQLEPEKIIFYQDFIENPNKSFLPVTSYFGLKPHHFVSPQKTNLNITGKPYQSGKNFRSVIPENDRPFCLSVMGPLYSLLPSITPDT